MKDEQHTDNVMEHSSSKPEELSYIHEPPPSVLEVIERDKKQRIVAPKENKNSDYSYNINKSNGSYHWIPSITVILSIICTFVISNSKGFDILGVLDVDEAGCFWGIVLLIFSSLYWAGQVYVWSERLNLNFIQNIFFSLILIGPTVVLVYISILPIAFLGAAIYYLIKIILLIITLGTVNI